MRIALAPTVSAVFVIGAAAWGGFHISTTYGMVVLAVSLIGLAGALAAISHFNRKSHPSGTSQ